MSEGMVECRRSYRTPATGLAWAAQCVISRSMRNDNFGTRTRVIQLLFLTAGLLLIGQAASLQLFDQTYANRAEATAVQKFTVYPARGLIYDRDTNLLIVNNPVYDLMVIYNQVDPDMDKAAFLELLGIDAAEYDRRIEKNWRSNRYSKRHPFVFLDKLSAETYARLQENLYRFPGFYVQTRDVRGYPYPHAAHVLGYTREVNRAEVDAAASPYSLGDYIGATGLERQYEDALRGRKGARYVLRDNLGREVGSYKDGRLDSLPVPGRDLLSTIDIKLQRYGEQLMANKKGAIVAIEPRTGEILSMISVPTYDPNLMTINRNRGETVRALSVDSLKPFFNRAVMAQYPPGSTFKPAVALVALQERVNTTRSALFCPGFYTYNGLVRKCRNHPNPTNLRRSLMSSCNTYYFKALEGIVDLESFYQPKVGLKIFTDHLYRMGLGKPLGIDFPAEEDGNVPTTTYYDKLYPSRLGGWKSPTISSIGIGQGEMQLTTVQMANMAALIANRGTYITPHLVRGFLGEDTPLPTTYREVHPVGIEARHFEAVVDGMVATVAEGTGRSAYIGPDVSVAGKTGTVQNRSGEDHSTFIAFAPAEDPQIAIAVYVENAGGGGRTAAPIASLLIEQYLTGNIRPARRYLEERIRSTDLLAQP